MIERPPFFRLAAIYIGLVTLCTSPIWFGGYFINQDGAAHVNNASIMLSLLSGSPDHAHLYSFNTFALPNSIGHWMLSGLLLFFSPFWVTKIIVTGIFGGTVAAAGFLRLKTAGPDGVVMSMLIGAAVSFNWLWLVGFYNFCIGAFVVVFAISFFSKWREEMSLRRTFAIATFLLLAYFSHLIAFAILLGALLVLSVFSPAEDRKRVIGMTIAAIIPTIPLALIYRGVSVASDIPFVPTWRSLDDVTSPLSWINQVRMMDPFIIISRKAFPFVESYSNIYTLFTPTIWIGVAILVIGVATLVFIRDERSDRPIRIEWLIMFSGLMVAAIFGPDDFGSVHGGVLRQRLFILGLLTFIPIFRFNRSQLLSTVAHGLLILVVAFQTLALWDYSGYSDTVGRELVSAQAALPQTGGIASISVVDNTLRYHSSPVTMINNLNGIGRNLLVWDNYELGHYLFPVILKHSKDKEFVYWLTRNSVLSTDVNESQIEGKLYDLDSIFLTDEGRIQTLLVWGSLPELDQMLMEHFADEPFYRSQNIRLFQRKPINNHDLDGK